MAVLQRITPHLWFKNEAEEAVKFYTSVFKNSKTGHISRYPEEGKEIHGQPPGSVMTIQFELDGQKFMALNGGPMFTFNESVSFIINCETQEEIDHYWDKLGAGGDPSSQQCGWLKDKFGLSWQVMPTILADILGGTDTARIQRTVNAVWKMKKLDIKTIAEA